MNLHSLIPMNDEVNIKNDTLVNDNEIFSPDIILKVNLELKTNNLLKKGNDKRIESCKQVGGEKKRIGHKREKEFLKQFNTTELENPIEYGATSDTSIDINHPICEILKTNLSVSTFNVSNKSGKNLQFTLGNIPELLNITEDTLSDKQLIRNIFNKYLKKSNSVRPADLLVYQDVDNSKWIFFNMDHVVEYIVENCKWRQLSTGRIKGDFADDSSKGVRQYITYEYRNTHKSYFLGLNGGKGIDFINLLMSNKYGIKYYCVPFEF